VVHHLHHFHRVHQVAVTAAHPVAVTVGNAVAVSSANAANASAASPANASAVGATRPTVLNSQLQGSASGSYSITPSFPASGADYKLSGNGQVNTLGNVQISAVIHSGMSGGKPQMTGTITLMNSKGSIQLSVQWNGGPQPLASTGSGNTQPTASNSKFLTYTIVGGTGSFRNMHGTGAVSLALLPSTVAVTPPVTGRTSPPVSVIPGGSKPGTPIPLGGPTFLHGNFVLIFNGGPIVWPLTL
jgi:hypothetical protein